MPKALSAEEVRDELLSHFMYSAKYWANLPAEDKYTGHVMTMQDRCEGVVHSVLCALDGVASTGLPPFTLVADVEPSYKEDCIEAERDWVEEGTTLGFMLHEYLYKK